MPPKQKAKQKKPKKAYVPKKPQTQPKPKASKVSNPNNPTFGNVSTVTTAPVSIGNSMRGFKARTVSRGQDSVRIVGRDFAATAVGTGTLSGWCLVAGVPLTPAAFVSSILRNYVQMYNKFKIHSCALHYITSSSTATNGDVLFQINANRSDPAANWTSTTFLPYALSREETVIGPQWTNHTVRINPKGPVRTLVTGSNGDIDYQAQGEMFLYSKTSSTDSPGYLMFDYDVSFYEMSINPRAGLLPNTNIIYQPTTIALNTGSVTTSVNPGVKLQPYWGGGQSVSAINVRAGDVFKCVIDATNTLAGTWTGTTPPTLATVLGTKLSGTSVGFTITDGTTLYLVIQDTSSYGNYLYPNPAAAFAGVDPLVGGSSYNPTAFSVSGSTPNNGVWFFAMISWVGNINPAYTQQQ